MKITSTIFFIAFLAFSVKKVSAQTTFEKKYGGTADDIGYSACIVPSGGYAVFGWTQSYGNGLADYYLIRTDQNGDTLWTKTFGGTNSESGLSLAATTDGGFILGGTTRSYGAGAGDYWLYKTDANGNFMWQRTYGGGSDDYLRDIKQTADGGYIFVGFTNSYGNGGKDVYLVKTNSNGDTLWTKTYGGPNDEEGWSINTTSGGGYVIGGWTQSFGNGLSDFYLLKTNSNGDTLWTKTYGGTNSDSGISAEQTSDGGYIFAGTTRSYGAGLGDIWLIKTNSNGDTLWTKTYGGTDDDYGRSLCVRPSGYGITGYTKSFGAGQADVYVVLTDNSGNKTNDYVYGGTNPDEGWRIYSSANNLLIVGQTSSSSNGLNDVYFIKMSDPQTSIIEFNNELRLSVYPNPVLNTLLIKGDTPDQAIIELYDMTGRKIFKKTVEKLNATTIDVSFLTKGIYLLEIKSNKKHWRTKIIKE